MSISMLTVLVINLANHHSHQKCSKNSNYSATAINTFFVINHARVKMAITAVTGEIYWNFPNATIWPLIQSSYTRPPSSKIIWPLTHLYRSSCKRCRSFTADSNSLRPVVSTNKNEIHTFGGKEEEWESLYPALPTSSAVVFTVRSSYHHLRLDRYQVISLRSCPTSRVGNVFIIIIMCGWGKNTNWQKNTLIFEIM